MLTLILGLLFPNQQNHRSKSKNVHLKKSPKLLTFLISLTYICSSRFSINQRLQSAPMQPALPHPRVPQSLSGNALASVPAFLSPQRCQCHWTTGSSLKRTVASQIPHQPPLPISFPFKINERAECLTQVFCHRTFRSHHHYMPVWHIVSNEMSPTSHGHMLHSPYKVWVTQPAVCRPLCLSLISAQWWPFTSLLPSDECLQRGLLHGVNFAAFLGN